MKPACQDARDVFDLAFNGNHTLAVDAAVAICQTCPMLKVCAKYAQDIEARYGPQLGVWAGTTPKERHNVGTITRTCELQGCNNNITVSRTRPRKYCSRSCLTKAYHLRRKHAVKVQNITRECDLQGCSKTFVTTELRPQRYCSNKCRYKASNQRRRTLEIFKGDNDEQQ